jgi:hypothetical protein
MKKTMNIDTELNKLQKLRPVSAPPFLFTRIEQRIASRNIAAAPALRYAVICTLILLAIVNGVVVSEFASRSQDSSGMDLVAHQLNLSPSYDPYE